MYKIWLQIKAAAGQKLLPDACLKPLRTLAVVKDALESVAAQRSRVDLLIRDVLTWQEAQQDAQREAQEPQRAARLPKRGEPGTEECRLADRWRKLMDSGTLSAG